MQELCYVLLLWFALLFAIASECARVKAPELCTQLLGLEARDAAVRLDRLSDWRDPARAAQMQAVDRENLACLEKIIGEHGWPGASFVGDRASVAAWTVIEHGDVDAQKRYLNEMTTAADDAELSWSLLATTIDRMRVREGKPQRFGTQFVVRGGKWVPEPIEDAQHVDDRRRQVGLPPLTDYAKTINATYVRR